MEAHLRGEQRRARGVPEAWWDVHGHRHGAVRAAAPPRYAARPWELVPVAELDGTACEGCSPPSAEPQAELQKPRCPKCGSYDTRKATVYWQCNTCHHVARSGRSTGTCCRSTTEQGTAEVAGSSSLDVNGDLMVLEDLDNAQGMARPCSAPTTRAQNASRARGARQPITDRLPADPRARVHRGRMGLRVDHARRPCATTVTTKTTRPLGRDGVTCEGQPMSGWQWCGGPGQCELCHRPGDGSWR